jgi:hypothetical protein
MEFPINQSPSPAVSSCFLSLVLEYDSAIHAYTSFFMGTKYPVYVTELSLCFPVYLRHTRSTFYTHEFYMQYMLPLNKVKVSRPVCLGVEHPSGAQDQIFVTVRQLWVCWCGVPSLMRGWDCHLQLLLSLTSTVILGSKFHGTHDHILLSQIWDSPSTEGPVPIFISPRNRVTQLYPQALGSLFIVSYNSQDCNEGI